MILYCNKLDVNNKNARKLKNMQKKVGRPKIDVEKIKVSKGFSLTKDNLNFIAGLAIKQQKKASAVLNNLLDNARKIDLSNIPKR